MPCQLVLLGFLHCAQHPLLSNWLAMVSLQVLISFKFAAYMVTASISMESASLTHFRRQTNKLNDFGLRNFCIIIGVLESMHAKLSCAHTNHILARVPERAVLKRQGVLNSCCKGPLVLIYKSEKSRLFSKYITPPLGNKFYQCMILEKSFGCLFPEGFLVCLLGFFIIESFYVIVLVVTEWFFIRA